MWDIPVNNRGKASAPCLEVWGMADMEQVTYRCIQVSGWGYQGKKPGSQLSDFFLNFVHNTQFVGS